MASSQLGNTDTTQERVPKFSLLRWVNSFFYEDPLDKYESTGGSSRGSLYGNP